MKKDPLWPAGHLPHKGGEDSRQRLASIRSRRRGLSPSPLWGGVGGGAFPHLLSPLAGDMAGRPEGGGFQRKSGFRCPASFAGYLHAGGEEFRHVGTGGVVEEGVGQRRFVFGDDLVGIGADNLAGAAL